MKKLGKLFLSLSAFFFLSMQLHAQIETPLPSPAALVKTTVGLTDVEISYFRPGVKGREIFGMGSDYLQPYGQLWRAGANSGSILKISRPITIKGKQVEAGEYLIFMVPNEEMWEFKLYSDISLGGNVNGYQEEKEVLSVMVEANELDETIERLTYQIADISSDNTEASIHFQWENTELMVPFTVSYDDVVMKQIQQYTKVQPSTLLQAANYYYTTDRDLEQALEWVNTYLNEGNNSQQFWNVHLKAKILAKMGKKKEAKTTAEKSMEMAKSNPNGDFGYVKLNKDLIDSL